MRYRVSFDTMVLGGNFREVGEAIQAAVDAAHRVGVELAVGYIEPQQDYPTLLPIAEKEDTDAGV